MDELRRLSDEWLEEMYGSYRSLARTHRDNGAYALSAYCRARSRQIVVELSRRYLESLEWQDAQLSLLCEESVRELDTGVPH
jgi:hypothetical protein